MKIFVSIASYRDPLLSKTVESIFFKAQLPDRIHIGVYNQINPDDTNYKVQYHQMNTKIRDIAQTHTTYKEVDAHTAGGC